MASVHDRLTVGFETDSWSWPNHPAETAGQGRAGGQHDVKQLMSILWGVPGLHFCSEMALCLTSMGKEGRAFSLLLSLCFVHAGEDVFLLNTSDTRFQVVYSQLHNILKSRTTKHINYLT